MNMNLEQIEAKDKQVMQAIRAAVKKNSADRPDPTGKLKSAPIRLFSGVLLVFLLAGVTVWLTAIHWSEEPAATSSNILEPKAPASTTITQSTRIESTGTPSLSAPRASDLATSPPLGASLPPQPASARKKQIEKVRKTQSPTLKPKHPPIRLAARQLEKKIADPKVKTKTNPVAPARILSLVACKSIKGHQPGSPQSQFASAPYIWMDITSATAPFTLTHVYFFEGKEYKRIPLRIRHRHMRTWSHLDLNSRHIGRWRVDVRDSAEKTLSRIHFSLTR